jgi:hypothetical protein
MFTSTTPWGLPQADTMSRRGPAGYDVHRQLGRASARSYPISLAVTVSMWPLSSATANGWCSRASRGRRPGRGLPHCENGEASVLGLYRADSMAKLDGLLEALPLYEWMHIKITSLEPHPNDPNVERPGSPATGSRQ